MTVFSDYATGANQPALVSPAEATPGVYDEVVAPDGTLRPGWAGFAEAAVQLTEDELRRVAGDIDRFLNNDGVTYTPMDGVSEPWRLDPLPMVLAAEEWATLEMGLAQRTELLNAISADLYGEQSVLARGIVPPAAVFGHRGFVRVAARASAQPHQPLLFCAADLGRSESGNWQVLADRVQAPSGLGFAMENRRVLSRVMPDLYRRAGLHRMAPYFQALRAALIAAGPDDRPNPRVVVLSPGPQSETAYDQSFVASSLGFPLVEGSDLTVERGMVWMRTFDGLERVDVILRRVDADWSDSLELRKESRLGVPGLSEVIRRGHVRVVNGLGSAVLENPALMPYLSQLCEVLLDEPLRLPSTQTWWCGDARSREQVLDRLGEVTVRAIDDPTDLSALSSKRLRELILTAPHRYVGQESLQLSVSPTLEPAGVRPLSLTLRTFTLRHGSGYRPLIGGLANVYRGLDPVSSKDVWVVKERPDDPDQGLADVLPMTNVRAPAAMVPRILEDMFWLGRYGERAEDTLRLVLAAHAASQDYATRPHSAGGATLQVLMDTLDSLVGPLAETSDERTHDHRFRSVLLDSHRPGSVAQSVHALRDAAQSVRDQLSPDVWHTFGSTDRAVAALRAYPYSHQIAESSGRMLTAILALHGVTDNMMRDPGWHLIGVGRHIERNMQLVRLLRSTATVRRGIDVDRQVHTAVLGAAESWVTHQRRYRGNVRVGGVLELLLLDEQNPRSLAFGQQRLRDHLGALPESSGSGRPERLLDDLADELERFDLPTLVAIEGERRPNLERFLDTQLDHLTRFADAVAQVHFAPAPVPRVFGFATVRE